MSKFRMLNVAAEGFQALEVARTKFDALEIDVEEIEQLKEKLFQQVMDKLKVEDLIVA